MVRLGRWVRFTVNPFLDEDSPGSNGYVSKPAGEGLGLYLELAVDLVGPVAPSTGLLVNVTDIDRAVRQFAVPVFAERIRAHLRRGVHIPLREVAEILRSAGDHLAEKFAGSLKCDVSSGKPGEPECDASNLKLETSHFRVDRLTLKLNPSRKLMMDANVPGVMYFSEKFEFAATHKLWNEAFSQQENFEIFGKCANPTGHGHNYLVEVTVATPADGPTLRIGAFERIVDTHLMELLDHKNLNLDVPEFRDRIATVENLAIFAWERLAGKFDPGRLHCITVWESDRTYCCYYGPAPTNEG